MDVDEMKRYVTSFGGVAVAEAEGDLFFFHDPDDRPEDRMVPFVTVVTGDHYEHVSRLDEPGSWRLNIGLPKSSYVALFGPAPTERDDGGILATGFDHAARDRVIPHPVYASQYWVCVIDPGERTLGAVREMVAEAHRFAVRKHANRQARRPGSAI